MIKHLNIRFYGNVQGVFFRQFVKDTADKLGITGFVRNEPDGTVYAEAEGEDEKINEFIESCKRASGVSVARVDQIDIKEGSLQNFKDFRVN